MPMKEAKGKCIKGNNIFLPFRILFFLTAAILACSKVYAVAQIQYLTVSPGTVFIGQNVTVTFQFAGDNTGCTIAYFAALSNQCAMQNGGSAGQAILVSEA